MPTPTEYNYTISGDFSAGVYVSGLKKEITSSADIHTAVDYLSVIGDAVTIRFKDALDALEQVTLNNLVAAHTGVKPQQSDLVEVSGHTQVEIVPLKGSRINFITPNFADATTWYPGSIRVFEEILSDSGDGLTWNAVGKPIVSMTQGQVFGEHDKLDEQGHSYDVVVTVDGVGMAEKDKHSGVGSYTVDYVNGTITFDSSQAGKQVKMTYHKSNGFQFYVEPAAGKKLTIDEVETQFSADFDIRDAVIFQAEGPVEVFAPHLVDAPYPAGTMIPLGSPTIYNTHLDFIRESNGAFPTIGISTNPAAATNWRMNKHAIQGYPWKYKAGLVLEHSLGMRIKISLGHDVEFGGEEATATFYCLSEDE